MATESLREGDRFRYPVEDCGCEITVTSAPEMTQEQLFVGCCGHEIEKVN